MSSKSEGTNSSNSGKQNDTEITNSNEQNYGQLPQPGATSCAEAQQDDGLAAVSTRGSTMAENVANTILASTSIGTDYAAAACEHAVAVVGPNSAAAASRIGVVAVGTDGAAATSDAANASNVAISGSSVTITGESDSSHDEYGIQTETL